MNLRELMNNNPALVTIGAVVLLIVCLALIVNQLSGGSGSRRIDSMYYYDLNTGKLFAAPTESVPPFPPTSDSSDASGVRAYVYSCGECGSDYTGMTAKEVQDNGGFIAYLEKYTTKAKHALENPDEAQDPGLVDTGRLLRLVNGKQWYKSMSKPGSQMEQHVFSQCPKGSNPKVCYP